MTPHPPGSRWWKCDLHVHTPASGDDYKEPAANADTILDAAVAAGIEILAITDHHSAGLTDEFQLAAKSRGLFVFPGFEVCASPGVHLLAIFDAGITRDQVLAVLGQCVDASDIGKLRACSSKSVVDIASVIADSGGLCLAAHADSPGGCLAVLLKSDQTGVVAGTTTLQQLITSQGLHGVEVAGPDTSLLGYLDNTKDGYKRVEGPIALLEGSDAHRPQDVGQRFTMLKMSRPSLEGLRLALYDGALSVRRGKTGEALNVHAGNYIEAISVQEARYLGRSKWFSLALNPWLNCIIGSHGTGKSTIVEFLRMGLGRTDEIPSGLTKDFDKYHHAYKTKRDEGLLTDKTVVEVVYRRDSARYRIRRTEEDGGLSVEQAQPDGNWGPVTVDLRSRLPVRIFSQKQIYRLADDPNAILRIIDEAPEVDTASIRSEIDQLTQRFFSLRAQIRGAEAKIKDEARLSGEVEDVQRRMGLYESSVNRDVLAAYNKVEEQQAALESWEASFNLAIGAAEQLADSLRVTPLAETLFPADALAPYRDVITAQEEASVHLVAARDALRRAVVDLRERLEATRAARRGSLWSEHVETAREHYSRLEKEGVVAGAQAKADYAALVTKRQGLQTQLQGISEAKAELMSLANQAEAVREEIYRVRCRLTSKRRDFLASIVGPTARVRIEVIPFGDGFDAEVRLREAIQKVDQTFQDQLWAEEDKGGLLHDLYRSQDGAKNESVFPQRLAALKVRLRAVACGTDDSDLHGKFITHLRKLPSDALDRLEILFPEDAVEISYLEPTGDSYRPISQGSPGQKSAAILAFILSYGGDPLVLDQPEDDLDGQLVSELIVEQLRQNKIRRQVLVVTHNPNIVVNGDAELILPFKAAGGETHLVGDGGGLQELSVRDQVCQVMEGGRDALQRRYRRIYGGPRR